MPFLLYHFGTVMFLKWASEHRKWKYIIHILVQAEPAAQFGLGIHFINKLKLNMCSHKNIWICFLEYRKWNKPLFFYIHIRNSTIPKWYTLNGLFHIKPCPAGIQNGRKPLPQCMHLTPISRSYTKHTLK